MRNHVYETLKTLDRRNSFIMLGPGISPRLQSGARASLVDIYPTILEALGYSLPDGRAALGVSLLSQRETLLRQIGLNRLNRAILSDSALRDRLWGLHRSM
jgi:phosphoglycerol transferase